MKSNSISGAPDRSAQGTGQTPREGSAVFGCASARAKREGASATLQTDYPKENLLREAPERPEGFARNACAHAALREAAAPPSPSPSKGACERGVYGAVDALATHGARVASVACGSAADAAGIAAGDTILAVDGEPVRDIIDWRWASAEPEFDVEFLDAAGELWETTVSREPGADVGIAFEGLIFDRVKTCKNACTFCFMRQLAPDMRGALSLRDDDWRLSFLTGTFVTLTNLTQGDFDRIVAQGVSPLRVSLHAADPDVRRELIGRSAAAGIEWLKRLLDVGIQVDAQIVLVPGVNDGKHLQATLEWAYAYPGITNVGIVPLGFTRFQTQFSRSFDTPKAAREVLAAVEGWQARAMRERATPWVFCADEFYRNAWGRELLSRLPQADFYGDFDLFEDGIGIIRTCVDEFRATIAAKFCEGEGGGEGYFVCGEAMMPYFAQLLEASPLAGRLRPLCVKNEFFGGNVNVTGLLCGVDIAAAIKRVVQEDKGKCDRAPDTYERPAQSTEPTPRHTPPALGSIPPRCGREGASAHTARLRTDLSVKRACQPVFFVPDVCFNDSDVTLDDMTLDDIAAASGARVVRVASTPAAYLPQILREL